MISDTERREIAEKLREAASTKGKRSGSMELMLSKVLGIAKKDTDVFDKPIELAATWRDVYRELADLIDRPTTTRHGKFRTKYGRETPCCEVCGYSIGDMRWGYCPKCGAVIADD